MKRQNLASCPILLAVALQLNMFTTSCGHAQGPAAGAQPGAPSGSSTQPGNAAQSVAAATAGQVTPAINKALLEGKQGHIVQLPDFLTEKLRHIDYKKVVLPGPQFLISDNPEYIRVPEGIALQEAVEPGTVRLYVYNVNGVKEPAKMDRKITAVIKNTGKDVLHIRMLRYSSQLPTSSYFYAGKQGLADFLSSVPEKQARSIKPGEAMAIDPALEKRIAKYDDLVHGFYEFVIDQPAEISIIQTDPATTGVQALARIKGGVLPSSHENAGRGLFGVSNYAVQPTQVLDTKNGVVQLVVADGEKDPWILGKESGTGELTTLDGNYGVLYNIDLSWKSSDGKGLALVTWNARADGQWCGGMANCMVVSEGKFGKGVVQLPSDQLITKRAPEAILVQVFPPAADGKEQKIHLTYSPPGASCLPTPLIFIPVDMKEGAGK